MVGLAESEEDRKRAEDKKSLYVGSVRGVSVTELVHWSWFFRLDEASEITHVPGDVFRCVRFVHKPTDVANRSFAMIELCRISGSSPN